MMEGISDLCSLQIDDVCILVIATANHTLPVHPPQLICEISVYVFEVGQWLCLIGHLGNIPDGDVSGVVAVGHPSLS